MNDAWSADSDRAAALDVADPLAPFRADFAIPTSRAVSGDPSADAGPCVYLTGNSLGLMPLATTAAVARELEDWAALGVEGHTRGRDPWVSSAERVREGLASLVGATPAEVSAMNTLTVNIHLLMVSFYRPTRERFTIIIEDGAFPSDAYAVASQARWHGFDPARAVVRVGPREGESQVRTEDVISAIERERPALVMLGGVNYRTGQWFDMGAITRAGRDAGAVVGWDLAHAAGNVPLRLHEWGVDFAAWCSYKYLNAGPGAVAGLYVHERHARDRTLPRFEGWWGHDAASRFRMPDEFRPEPDAAAWALSNPPILSLAPLKVSLGLFARAGMDRLRDKSLRLTAFMESMLRRVPGVRVLTPADPDARGCQLSIEVAGASRETQRSLLSRGVVCDYREPGILRAAPVPLYNSFRDAWRFARALDDVVRGGGCGDGSGDGGGA
ncbi:MAG: kynureninase [Phycisphaeraceae bacterium]|nr:MAG: kynureninase [Phycisphaeraceae bacterium]